jgi:hypothetical protein
MLHPLPLKNINISVACTPQNYFRMDKIKKKLAHDPSLRQLICVYRPFLLNLHNKNTGCQGGPQAN